MSINKDEEICEHSTKYEEVECVYTDAKVYRKQIYIHIHITYIFIFCRECGRRMPAFCTISDCLSHE